MERVFCKDKKNFCECLEDCRKCEFAKGHGVISGYIAHDVLATLFGTDYDLERIAELVQADREGRCVVLPCSKGDELWTFCTYPMRSVYKVRALDVSTLNGRVMINTDRLSVISDRDIGKTVFLTREAAEKALEMEDK